MAIRSSRSPILPNISAAVPSTRLTVLDGEIVCVDKRGRPQFKDLLFRRGDPSFFAFDLLAVDGKDWRTERLTDRRQELRRLLKRVPADSRLHYVDHVDGLGTALFQRVCEMDLEGIVAKLKFAPYAVDRENSTWFKIRNRKYSQMAGEKSCLNVSGIGSQCRDGTPVRCRVLNWKQQLRGKAAPSQSQFGEDPGSRDIACPALRHTSTV